jgi:hypothetical protein
MADVPSRMGTLEEDAARTKPKPRGATPWMLKTSLVIMEAGPQSSTHHFTRKGDIKGDVATLLTLTI